VGATPTRGGLPAVAENKREQPFSLSLHPIHRIAFGLETHRSREASAVGDSLRSTMILAVRSILKYFLQSVVLTPLNYFLFFRETVLRYNRAATPKWETEQPVVVPWSTFSARVAFRACRDSWTKSTQRKAFPVVASCFQNKSTNWATNTGSSVAARFTKTETPRKNLERNLPFALLGVAPCLFFPTVRCALCPEMCWNQSSEH
jgi:hypothetical protein